MLELTAAQRGAGGDTRPALRTSTRQVPYGTATTDPMGREGKGWHVGDSKLPVPDKGYRRCPKTGRAVLIEKRETAATNSSLSRCQPWLL